MSVDLSLLEKRIKALEQHCKIDEEVQIQEPKEITLNKEKKERKPSKYNEFMKTEIAKLKEENKNLKHTEVFKMATQNYKLKNIK